MKKTLFSLCLMLLLGALICSATAGTAGTVILDKGDLLTETQIASLSALPADPVSDVRFFILTGNGSSYPSDQSVLNLCGLTSNDSAVILYLRHYNNSYYYDLYTFGTAYSYFSNEAVDRLLDDPDVHDNLKSGLLSKGLSAFLTKANDICREEAAKEAKKTRTKPIKVVITGIIVGLIGGGVSALAVVLSYRKKQHGESYPLNRFAKLHLTNSTDRFVGSFVTRTRRVKTSSFSGGGGSMGRGGGGGSSGGGHRGGR